MIVILIFSAGNQLLCAQNRSFIVDSLTTVIDGSYPPFNQVHPGDTILFEHGMRDFILLRNFQGEAGNPVIIINGGGVVKINTDHYYGISIRNCRYFKLTGTGDLNHFYGFMVERVEQGGGIGIGEKSSDFELDHVSIENCHGVGVSAKTDPDCSFLNTRDQFTQYNTIIHDCFISGVSFEGMYIGSTKYFGQTVKCDGVDTLLMPSLLDGVRIYNNIIKNTGWDGIQVSSASNNCQIYNNTVLFDSQENFHNQMSGIIIGGGSKCDCFNNLISDGNGNGIESHGLGGQKIFNNIIINAGFNYLPLDRSQMRHGIFVSDITLQPDSSLYIQNNTIINPKSDGIRFSSIKSRNNLIASNAIINPGNFDFYENGNTRFKGIDSYVMIPSDESDVILANNFFALDITDANMANDYSPKKKSPLIDAGFTGLPTIEFDYNNLSRPVGKSIDIGAFEYNLETGAYLYPDNQNSVLVFPNPAQSNIYFSIHLHSSSELELSIFNLFGEEVLNTKQYILNPESFSFKLDIEHLKPGIYMYSVKSDDFLKSGKFIKPE